MVVEEAHRNELVWLSEHHPTLLALIVRLHNMIPVRHGDGLGGRSRIVEGVEHSLSMMGADVGHSMNPLIVLCGGKIEFFQKDIWKRQDGISIVNSSAQDRKRRLTSRAS